MLSSSFSRLKSAVFHGFRTNGGGSGIQDAAKIISNQVILVRDNYKLFCSLPLSTLADLDIFFRPGTLLARSVDSVADSKRKFSVVGTLSRTIAIPSVSGPPFQSCGYYIERFLSEPALLLSAGEKQKSPMAAASFSKAAFGDCFVKKLISGLNCNTTSINNASVLHCKASATTTSCTSASMSLKNHAQIDQSSIYGYYLYKALTSCYRVNQKPLSGSAEFHSSSASTLTEITADGSFDSSFLTSDLANVAMSPEGNITSERALTLLSGSCCLPHPEKEETGGEDAHFICPEEQAVGVADGVGGWAEVGIDAGKYARELMSNAVSAIREEPKGNIDLVRVLEKAHSITKAKGSSTACIVALTDRLESGDGGDLPSCGQVFSVPVAPGDVIIAGTDGLFDNLYGNEVTAVVVNSLKAGLGPQMTAQKIAALARQRAQDRHMKTPFSTAAQDAGFQYYGGKLDDITVVVSYITSCNKEIDTSLPARGSNSVFGLRLCRR